MAKKLFVGGLSWDTTDDGLRQAFASYGEITEAKVITDRDTGRSRGFGFVTFAQDEDAKTAISKMDGTSLDGKTIKVNEAQEKSPRGGGRSAAVVLGAVVAAAVAADAIAGSSDYVHLWTYSLSRPISRWDGFCSYIRPSALPYAK